MQYNFTKLLIVMIDIVTNIFVKLINVVPKLFKIVQNSLCNNIVFIFVSSICEYCLIWSTIFL